MSKEYYVTKENSGFFVNRPNGCLLTCAANEENAKYICAELNRLLHRMPAREEDEMELFPPITLEDAIKNTGSTPKYDPCRKFREGDIVRLVEWNGRKLWDDIKHLHRIYNEKGTFTVHDNEQGKDVVIVPDAYTENVYCVCPACLELVTPVEELEPFYVCENTESRSFEVRRKEDHKVQAAFYYFNKDNAPAKSAAAKATLEHCDRLNAEYRKEMEL